MSINEPEMLRKARIAVTPNNPYAIISLLPFLVLTENIPVRLGSLHSMNVSTTWFRLIRAISPMENSGSLYFESSFRPDRRTERPLF